MMGGGLLAFLFGIGFARWASEWSSLWLVIAGVLLLVSLRGKPIALFAAIMLLGFVLGWWRGAQMLVALSPYQELYDQKIIVQVTAETDATYNDRKQLEFDAGNIEVIEPFATRLPGKVRVSGFGEPAVFRGDHIQAEGRMYRTRGSRQGGISFAELALIERQTSMLEITRLRFVAGMQTALPEPLASFAVGLLVGARSNLPDKVSDELGAVGLTHIIAVSGYNLTIIMRAVRRFLRNRSKYQTTIISVVLMGAFLLVTGFSASIVRAAIVSGLSLWAWYYGRSIKPLLLILIAAAVTSAWNPLYVWSDIGWYLSFLAFFGVLILAPLLTRRFYAKRQPKLFASVAIESICAQIMTVPLVLWIFQEVSIVAPLSNLLIVPLVPLAMLLALGAGLAGMLVPALSGWLAWPAKILLTYMLDIVTIFASIPRALVKRSLSFTGMMALYVALAAVTFVLWQKAKFSQQINKTDIY
jgi:competence protein ComEC